MSEVSQGDDDSFGKLWRHHHQNGRDCKEIPDPKSLAFRFSPDD